MFNSLKKFLRFIVPASYRSAGYLTKVAMRKSDLSVQSGPFRGMRYIRGAHYSAFVPKIVGIYEREIEAVVNSCCEQDFSLVIDIGAAEGYYAVGFGLRCPKSKIVAFEQSAEGRFLLESLINTNECKNIDVRGRCDVDELKSLIEIEFGSILIFCDCEGFETTLLDPLRINTLSRVSILVETHDVLRPGICAEIKARFCATHIITEFVTQDRLSTDYPYQNAYIRLMPDRWLIQSVSEMRGGEMVWLWMVPIDNT